MKLCPQCETGYPDSESICPLHGGPLTKIADLPPGLVIGGTYRIQRKLGEGSTGSVYLAEEIPGGERKALKFLSGEFSGDESFTSRFERAAKELSDLHHPNVLATEELQRAEDDSLFYAMEYVDGPSLRVLLNIAPDLFDPGLTLSIARCVAEGLRVAHAAGFVHLDLTPENILIAREADSLAPKIANFGFGAIHKGGDTFLTAGRKLFTPAYASPEQWLDTRTEQLDGRIDLYALGGVLFEMLTRETVFHADEYHAWARQHLTAPPRIPSELRPELAVWRGLDDLVLTLLAKQPKDRPADAAAVLELLDAVQFGSRFLQIPRIHFVEDSHPSEDDPEPEALPPEEPAEEPEAAVQASSADTPSHTEPTAEDEPVSVEEAPILLSQAFTAEPVAAEPEVQPAEPEAAPHPNAIAPVLNAPEPVEERDASEPPEDPTVSLEPAHPPANLSDPEFAPPAPEFIPPTEAESIPIATAELPTTITPPEPVEELVPPEQLDEPVVAPELPHFSDPEFAPPQPEFIPPAEAEPIPIAAAELTATFTPPEPVEQPVIEPEPAQFAAPEFRPSEPEPMHANAPELPSTFAPPIPADNPAREQNLDMEELNRLFGLPDLGVKSDDAPRRAAAATSIFGPHSTGLGREEWPPTAEPTNFFGVPYTPALPEAPPLLVPELPGAFSRADTSTAPVEASGQPQGEGSQPPQAANAVSWLNSGKAANPSTLLPGATPVPETDNEQQAVKAEGNSGHHRGRTFLIGFAVVLLLAAAGFAVWRYALNAANQPPTKMNLACSSGDGKACYDLGDWYEQTNAVSDRNERASALYSQSCELNFSLACRKLGLKYLSGAGIALDVPKAIELFTKACDKADVESCDNLGDIYHEGKGVPVDDVKAAAIYDKACTAGDEVGCKWSKRLAPPPAKPVLRHPAPPAADSDTAQ
jgi:serine/threonine-protein kinase